MQFEFYIGGYPGPFFHLKKEDDFLHCIAMPGVENKGIEQSILIKDNEQWKGLVQFLEMQQWNERYEDFDVVDGTGWELTFLTPAVKLQSSGSNAYPPYFDEFLDKLNEVTSAAGVIVG